MHRVLVIDDQRSVRAAMRLSLEYMGLTVEEAENGKDGLEKARASKPSLIICDLDMPVMDGFETLIQVRRDPLLNGVPVIVISAMMTSENERCVMLAGANAVLPKPYSLTVLASLVKHLCAG